MVPLFLFFSFLFFSVCLSVCLLKGLYLDIDTYTPRPTLSHFVFLPLLFSFSCQKSNFRPTMMTSSYLSSSSSFTVCSPVCVYKKRGRNHTQWGLPGYVVCYVLLFLGSYLSLLLDSLYSYCSNQRKNIFQFYLFPLMYYRREGKRRNFRQIYMSSVPPSLFFTHKKREEETTLTVVVYAPSSSFVFLFVLSLLFLFFLFSFLLSLSPLSYIPLFHFSPLFLRYQGCIKGEECVSLLCHLSLLTHLTTTDALQEWKDLLCAFTLLLFGWFPSLFSLLLSLLSLSLNVSLTVRYFFSFSLFSLVPLVLSAEHTQTGLSLEMYAFCSSFSPTRYRLTDILSFFLSLSLSVCVCVLFGVFQVNTFVVASVSSFSHSFLFFFPFCFLLQGTTATPRLNFLLLLPLALSFSQSLFPLFFQLETSELFFSTIFPFFAKVSIRNKRTGALVGCFSFFDVVSLCSCLLFLLFQPPPPTCIHHTGEEFKMRTPWITSYRRPSPPFYPRTFLVLCLFACVLYVDCLFSSLSPCSLFLSYTHTLLFIHRHPIRLVALCVSSLFLPLFLLFFSLLFFLFASLSLLLFLFFFFYFSLFLSSSLLSHSTRKVLLYLLYMHIHT